MEYICRLRYVDVNRIQCDMGKKGTRRLREQNRGGAVPREGGGGELGSAELDTGSILNEWWMRLGMIWNVGQLGKCYPPRPKGDANEK